MGAVWSRRPLLTSQVSFHRSSGSPEVNRRAARQFLSKLNGPCYFPTPFRTVIVRHKIQPGRIFMRGVSAVTFAAALAVVASLSGAAQAQVTAFEGARIIVGDGRSIENATLVVDGSKIIAAGASDIHVPAGATHVNLAGKTVMPMLIDVHTHLSQTRE